MAVAQTYKVLFNNVTIKSSPSLLSYTLGYLKKGTLVEVLDITGLWARIKYNNKYAYVIILYLDKVEQVITGSITIKYLNVDTNVEILQKVTKDNLSLNTYYYTAPAIENYTVVEPSTKSTTLTQTNPNQEIVFYYKENIIYGSVTVNYVDKSNGKAVSSTKIDKNLILGTYSYEALPIAGYRVSGDSSKSVILTKNSNEQSITFEYDKILGKVTVEYIDTDTKIAVAPSDVYSNLALGSYTYNAKSMEDYTLVGESSQVATLTDSMNEVVLTFVYKKNNIEDDIYAIDLKKYGISNDNTNGNSTTIGINKALVDAKAAGYKRVKLPEGVYSIDTSVKNPIVLSDGTNRWTHNRQGISMQSDMELILDGTTLQMIPCEDPYYSILTISNCTNSKITGGTILGDRETHDYGMRINESGDMFESGDFDSTTGEPKVDDTKVRTKGFISVYKDWFTGKEEPLPTNFYIIPLWNTTMNTVDGGCRYIYCYDKDGNYLGLTTGGVGYIKQATLLPNTSKIKISVRGEKRLDIVLAMTKRTLYYTYEFGSGLTVASSNSIEINGTTIKNCIGDCICTFAPPLKVTVDNINIINCTLENSRRQGISFVATGENYLLQGCNIGKINGVDPQSGIDIEHYDYVKNVVIDKCNFYDNKKWDIINYNGNDIEIENSNFTGGIATTFGNTMTIHDNLFKYKDTENNDKVYKNISLNLGTTNNLVYNNQVIGGNIINSGVNCKTYNNIFNNSSITVTSDGSNKYYNCSVGINQSSNITQLTSNYFENSKVFNNNDEPSIEINDCTFENSTYIPRGKTLINNCIYNMTTKPIIDNWMTDVTNITYTSCTINSTYSTSTPLLGYYIKTKATFDNCKFNISRYTLALSYGTFTFNNSSFIFNDLNTSENIVDLNKSGYGFITCPWYFSRCYFKSNLPVKIYGGNVTSPTIDGPISIA